MLTASSVSQRPLERDHLLVKQLLQLLAIHVVLHEIKLEEMRIQRLGRRLILGVVVGLQVRVLEALGNGVSLPGINCLSVLRVGHTHRSVFSLGSRPREGWHPGIACRSPCSSVAAWSECTLDYASR